MSFVDHLAHFLVLRISLIEFAFAQCYGITIFRSDFC